MKVATTVSTIVPMTVMKIASSGSVPPLTWIVRACVLDASSSAGSAANGSLIVGLHERVEGEVHARGAPIST
jgi:hypothetical protein